MSNASLNIDFDSRLLEIEELYRQRKPDVAQEKVKSLIEGSIEYRDFEEGLFKFLEASYFFYKGDYLKADESANHSNRLLASSIYHTRVGRVQLLLYRIKSEFGDYKLAENYAHDALAFFRRSNDKTGIIAALNGLARISFIRCQFPTSVEFIEEAIIHAKGDNIRMTELVGNLGRVEILSGDWNSAGEHLLTALKLSVQLKQEVSSARNHLSIGFLKIRQRQFAAADREFSDASAIIQNLDLYREKLLLMEYQGELAYEMGDMIQAKKILSKAQDVCRKAIPESALSAQINRRLAQVEMFLDNLDNSLSIAQKSLDIATKIGERNEIGLSQVAMAEIFTLREDFSTALKYIRAGIDDLRVACDPYDVARSLVVQAGIYEKSGKVGVSSINKSFEEAGKIFGMLNVWYHYGETIFKQAVYCCNTGRISAGFSKLIEAERIFEKISDKSKMRSIKLFKQELSKQAVATAVSNENEFKIFGDYFSENEYSGLKFGKIDNILEIVGKRTNSSRVVLYKIDSNESENTIFSYGLDEKETKRFSQRFEELLGQEFADDKPTLILDSRRDPFINQLLSNTDGQNVSSVIVVPLSQDKSVKRFIYLDRVSKNGNFKPFGQSELNFTVGFADLINLKLAEFERQLLEEDNRRLKEQLMEKAAFPNIITQNQPMLDMLSRVKQIVNSNISISITGETGSGKDLLAKAIHFNSNRCEKRFISVNCAALPESLLESELFGHKRGAFTGADRDKVGLFEEADKGTFFLDEIADMPLSIQAKILRILEEKELVRLGDTKPIKVDVRIVSATNKDLKTEMEGGRFRQDLYYRLTALCFVIPPLRERKEDIPLLINHFGDNTAKFTPEVMKELIAFDWPGNVRELENEIKKLTLLAGENGLVDVNLLSGKIHSTENDSKSAKTELTTEISFDETFSLYDYLAEYERRFIVKALLKNSGVKKHAAQSLNIPESTLRLKIKQYKIDLKNLSAA